MSYTPESPGPYPGGPDPARPATNKKAIWALVTGILGICLGPLGLVAIFLGRKAQTEIAASGGQQTGAGLAKAGFIIGIVVVVLWAISLILRYS